MPRSLGLWVQVQVFMVATLSLVLFSWLPYLVVYIFIGRIFQGYLMQYLVVYLQVLFSLLPYLAALLQVGYFIVSVFDVKFTSNIFHKWFLIMICASQRNHNLYQFQNGIHFILNIILYAICKLLKTIDEWLIEHFQIVGPFVY